MDTFYFNQCRINLLVLLLDCEKRFPSGHPYVQYLLTLLGKYNDPPTSQ